ncbi:hypothetical protein ACROYT_G003877 [Oculina patagonica]
MNAVVQCILDCLEEQSSMLDSKPIRIIDLTEDFLVQRTPKEMSSATVKQLAQTPVDEGVLCSVRGELNGEVGDLLPREYKFCRRGFPVSIKQEEGLQLNACICTIQPNEVGEQQDTCDVSSDYCLEIKDFVIRDNTEAMKVTPPRAGINRFPITGVTGAVTSVIQTGIP